GDDDLLRYRGDAHRHGDGKHLADGEVDVFLEDRGEAGFGDGERVMAGREIQDRVVALVVGGFGALVVGVDVGGEDGGFGDTTTFFIDDGALHSCGGHWGLSPGGCGECKNSE